jgi:hypothetical protein
MNTRSKGLNKAVKPPVLVHCWWDMGPIEESKSIPIINHYETKTDKFTEQGYGCSSNCIKAFLISLNCSQVRKQQLLSWNWMYQRQYKPACLVVSPFVKPAPDNKELEFFVKGGTKLEVYRAKYCINKM